MVFFRYCWFFTVCFHVALQSVLASIQSDCLEQHNLYRRRHQVSDVTYSSKLGKQAQRLADFMAQADSELEYTQRSARVDENVYHGHAAFPLTISDAVQKWYSEDKLYNYNKPNPTSENKSFIQLVWKSFKSIGCGYAVVNRKDGAVTTYMVTLYAPPARPTSTEEYISNVLAPK